MKNTVLYSLMLIVAFATACSKNNSNSHTVKYKVGGTAKLNVTYSDQNWTLQSVNSTDSTWTYSFTTNSDGKVVALSVISQDSSNVSAHIYIDNQQSAQDNGSNHLSISAQIP